MVRGELLKRLGGFDEQFYYYYEDLDLCHRIWDAGFSILFTPDVIVTHLGGQSTKGRFPVAFALDKYRNRYRYFYKYFGARGVRRCRYTTLAWLWVRWVAFRAIHVIRPVDASKERLQLYRIAAEWNRRVDPVQLVEHGKEPEMRRPMIVHVPQ
jgi:GT2 family glycosyltransferase